MRKLLLLYSLHNQAAVLLQNVTFGYRYGLEREVYLVDQAS